MGKTLVWIFLFGCVAGAHAAEPLTWDACVALAVQNNPDLLSAQRSVLAKKAQYSGSFNGIFPRLNLSNSYNDSKSHPINSRWQAGGTASIDLFNQSKFADIKTASAGFNQADANLRLVASSVLFDLRKAFTDILFAQEQIGVSRRVREIRERNSELVSLRYASGRESKGNMLRAKAELLQADADQAQSERDLRTAQYKLDHQLGNDEFSALTATGTLTASKTLDDSTTFEPLVSSHPSVLLQDANFSLSQAALKQSRSVLWPTLSANYTRSFQGPDYFPDQPNWTAAGVLSLPIFGGGPTSAYYAVSSARRNLEKAEQDRRSTRNQVRSALEAGWAGFAGAKDQVNVQIAFLEAARQRNGEADVRYSSGLMTYENWEQIVTDRVNFERSLVRAQRDAVIAEAQWQKALGKGLGK